MSGSWDGGGGWLDDPDGDRERDAMAHDPFGPPERLGTGRGVLITVVAFVLGALLLPSATRAPLSVAAGSTSPSSSTSTTSTTVPTSSTTTAPAASTVHVLVANATTVNGVAGSVTTFLGGKGYSTLTPTNALERLTSSEVFYTSAGSAAEATQVASVLGLSSAVIQPAGAKPPVSSDAGASVVVIAGQDLAARFPASSTTTTTSRG